jgi:hypothetical protein
MRILGDVAPYSREYQKYSGIVRHQSTYDSDTRAEYERIQEQVRQTKESTLQVAQKHFNAPVDTIEGTVERASAEGIELAEYPGRTFHFSSVGSSMADLTADTLGRLTRLGPSPPGAHKIRARAGTGVDSAMLLCLPSQHGTSSRRYARTIPACTVARVRDHAGTSSLMAYRFPYSFAPATSRATHRGQRHGREDMWLRDGAPEPLQDRSGWDNKSVFSGPPGTGREKDVTKVRPASKALQDCVRKIRQKLGRNRFRLPVTGGYLPINGQFSPP